MALKTIETRAVISAQDKTGNTFAAVAQKLKKMEDTAKSAGRGVASATRAANTAERAGNKAYAATGAALRATGVSTFVTGAAAAIAGGAAAHKLIEAGSERVHETMRMYASGMSANEIQNATQEAAKLATKFTPVNQTAIMHMMRNARSIVGSYQEAAEIMDPLLKLRVIAQANRPGQDVSEDFDQLVKGLEIKGVTQHPEQFKQYMEGIAKGLNVFGDTLKPYQYYEMFKYGRQATQGLSEKFILSTAPTLAQELGGSSYGNAVSAFNRSVVGGKMDHAAFATMVKLGLVDEDDVLRNAKTHEAKGFKPGAGAKGWQLAQSDPNEWVKQYLIPALDKAGYVDNEQKMQMIGQLFSNRSAAQMVGLLATQQSRINKDAAMLSGAPGLASADRYMREDTSMAMASFREKLHDALGTMGEGLARGLTPAIKAATDSLARFSAELQISTAQRAAGETTEGQKKANRFLNHLFNDIDSDRSNGDATMDEVTKSKLARLRGKIGDRNWLRRERAAQLAGIDPDDQSRWPKPTTGDIFGNGAVAAWLREHPSSRGLSDRFADARDYDHRQALYRGYMRRRGALGRLRAQMRSASPFEDRVDMSGSASVLGSAAMPMSIGYAGVLPRVAEGAGYRPAVALPPGVGTAGKPAPPQKVDVHVTAAPMEIKNSVTVTAGSALISVVDQAKEATRKANLSATVGSTGSTDFGNQQ